MSPGRPLTDSAWSVINAAREEAVRMRAAEVGTEHLLLALSHVETDPIRRAFEAMGVRGIDVARVIAGPPATDPVPRPLPLSANATAVMDHADRAATVLGADHVDAEHILLALLKVGGRAGQAVEKLGLSLSHLRSKCMDALRIADDARPSLGAPPPAPSAAAESLDEPEPAPDPGLEHGVLPARELTRSVESLSCIGREKELEAFGQVMDREDRTSLFLIGPPGCGRRTLVRAYARRLQAMASPGLPRRQIYLFEPELARKAAPPVFEGEGAVVGRWVMELLARAESGIFVFSSFIADEWVYDDFVDFVVPAVERRWAACVFIVSVEERRELIRRHPQLNAMTIEIALEPLSRELALEAVAARARGWPEADRVSIAETALQATVNLAVKFLPGTALPGSAVDILERTRKRIRGEYAKRSDGDVVIGTGEIVRTVVQLSGKPEDEVRAGGVWA